MTEESSFEIINKKAEGFETDSNEDVANGGTSLMDVTQPSGLPHLVPSSSKPTFHQKEFSPEIPENKGGNVVSAPSPQEEKHADPYGTAGLFGWVKDTVGTKGTDMLMKVAEQAKKSVGSVITTLDPQMGDFLPSKGGKLDVLVLSEKEVEVSPIREAFLGTLGHEMNVRGVEVELETAKQIVGFEAALRVATEKINALKGPNGGRFIVVQNFIVKILEDKWFDLDLLVLEDTEKDVHLETFSQMIPVPASIVNVAMDETPLTYANIQDGFSVTIASLMASNLQVHSSEWQEQLTYVSRRKRILSAAIVLANLYNNTLF